MFEQLDLPAVKDKELKEILDFFGISEKLNSGQLKCYSCSKILTWENIGALLPHKGSLLLCCDIFECIEYLKDFVDN